LQVSIDVRKVDESQKVKVGTLTFEDEGPEKLNVVYLPPESSESQVLGFVFRNELKRLGKAL